ncbi:dihydrofolate reductase family protein, partial [Staphylococcus haemolyticus]
NSQFLQNDFINQIIIYYAPKIIGGSGKNQFYQTADIIDLNETTQF